MTEIWKPVVGHEGAYEVSDQGRVRSRDRIVQQLIARGPDRSRTVSRRMRGRLLRPVKAKSGGYLRVSLSAGSTGSRIKKVHQLVCEAFIGPCPHDQMPLHGDGDPTNNRLNNLRYGTGRENVADAVAHGTFVLGEARSQAKITAADAGAIKSLLPTVSMARLGRAFGISSSAVAQIRDGLTWKHALTADAQTAQRELDRRAGR